MKIVNKSKVLDYNNPIRQKPKICFLVGSMSISGGTYVIIQHAIYLQNHGYDVTLGIQEAFTPTTLSWHDRANALRCLPISSAKMGSYDLVIATWWKTVFELKDFNSDHYAYFIQSIESRFYPESEKPLRALVDSTYRFPLSFVTEASWIKRHLAEHFCQTSALVRNGIRKDVYSTQGVCIEKRNPHSPRILVEGHFGVSFKNTALAIRLAKEAGCRNIWVLTGSPVSWIPGVNRLFSRVPMTKTPEIYRSCDILLKLSTVEGMFGPPLEMFHCGGTALVFDVSGHDEYITQGINACVVSQENTDRVVRILNRLINDKDYLAHLKIGAIKTAEAWPDWSQSSEKFRIWIDESIDGPKIDRQTLIGLTELAYSDYSRRENQRLKNNPIYIPRHKLSALVSRLPESLVSHTKQLEAVFEVLFGCKRAF